MKTILIIEDHYPLAMLFSRILHNAGYVVKSVNGGDAALAYLQENRPDLVLLDIMMEPIDGWEVLTRIREKKDLHDLPVIILTARPPSPEIVRLFSSSIDGYVMKPVGSTALKEMVDDFFDERTRIEEGAGLLARKKTDPGLIQEYRTLSRRKKLNESLLAVQKKIGIEGDPLLVAELSRYATLQRQLFA